MTAGLSAQREAARAAELARELRAQAAEHDARAGRFRAASRAEQQVVQTLQDLTAAGFRFLPDRKWPGSRNAQIDLVIVGRSGVFIIDVKLWNDFHVQMDHVFRGQEDVTEDLLRLETVADSTRDALAEIGVAPGEIHTLVIMAGHRNLHHQVGPIHILGEFDASRFITSPRTRHTVQQVDDMVVVLQRHFAPIDFDNPRLIMPPEMPPTPPAGSEAAPSSSGEPIAVAAVEPLVTAAEMEQFIAESVLQAPIQQWMTHLHPEQAKLAKRTFNGAVRIRGAAGTGKTVVGLHRVAHLARQFPNDRILFVTFVRSLPKVMRSLLAQLAPDVTDRVEFRSVHSIAAGILKQAKRTAPINAPQANVLFHEAWEAVGKYSPLGASTRPERYWQEEVNFVIKGRGLASLEEYLQAPRTGRRLGITIDQRRAVWDLFEEYQRRCMAAKVLDFHDQILLAEDLVIAAPQHPYRAVVIDEAQDLTCAMARLLRRLAPDLPDALTLIGDGQQRVYPGGYTLNEAGITISGRGIVLGRNYRNTAQIMAFAQRVLAGETFDDIEGSTGSAEPVELALRAGEEPLHERFPTRAALFAAIPDLVQRALAIPYVGLGDVGIVTMTNRDAREILQVLERHGIPSMDLESFDGSQTEHVKVGTGKRAKGLEFKYVLVPGVSTAEWERCLSDRTSPDDEDMSLLRRELYVAMTRARDGLWVGTIDRSVTTSTSRNSRTATPAAPRPKRSSTAGSAAAAGPRRR